MVPDYTAQMFHQSRLRDAARAYAHQELIHEASADKVGLFQHVKQMVRLPQWQAARPQPQPIRDTRTVHAV